MSTGNPQSFKAIMDKVYTFFKLKFSPERLKPLQRTASLLLLHMADELYVLSAQVEGT